MSMGITFWQLIRLYRLRVITAMPSEMRWLYTVALLCVVLAVTSGQTCNYDFTGSLDLAILMDNSGSVSNDSIDSYREAVLRNLITQRLLIGPESQDYTRLTLVSFYKNTHALFPDSNFIDNPLPVYESEFLAPNGLFDKYVTRTIEPEVDLDPANTGIAEGINSIRRLFVENHTKTRRKVLLIVSDFHFDGDGTESLEELQETEAALKELRRNINSINGSLMVYGVAVGYSKNITLMETLLEFGNGPQSPGTCQGGDLESWIQYLRGVGTIPAKADNFGPRRPFYSRDLCCYMCNIQNNRSTPNCSLPEFQSFKVEDIMSSIPLQCTGATSLCGTTLPGVVTPSGSTTFGPEGPEGPEDPEDENSREEEDEEEEEEEEGTAGGMATSSWYIVAFAIINIVLIVGFILVAVYGNRLMKPLNMMYMNKNKRRTTDRIPGARSGDNTYMPHQTSNRDHNVIMPTRTAPVLPILTPPRVHDDDSGIVNEADANAEDDTIYENTWVADDNDLNRQRDTLSRRQVQEEDIELEDSPEYLDIAEDRGDYVNIEMTPSNRFSYLQIMRDDAHQRIDRIRDWGKRQSMGTASVRRLPAAPAIPTNAPPSDGAPGALSPSQLRTEVPKVHAPQKKISPFKKMLQNKKERRYENQDTIQDIHDQFQNQAPGQGRGFGQGNGQSNNAFAGNTLRRKLDERKRKIEQDCGEFDNSDALYELREQRQTMS